MMGHPSCRAILALTILWMFLMGCERRSEGMLLEIEGQAVTLPERVHLEGLDFTLLERAVEDGALQAEAIVAEAESNSEGLFTIAFPRRSSYSLRWTAAAEHHFPGSGALDPEGLFPNVPYPLELGMYPICTLHVSLASAAPEDSTDRIQFNLGDDFDCPCCPTDPVVLEGVGADSAWSCLMYGNHWMTWGADLEVALIGQPDGLFIDSVYCPSFGSTELNLTW